MVQGIYFSSDVNLLIELKDVMNISTLPKRIFAVIANSTVNYYILLTVCSILYYLILGYCVLSVDEFLFSHANTKIKKK